MFFTPQTSLSLPPLLGSNEQAPAHRQTVIMCKSLALEHEMQLPQSMVTLIGSSSSHLEILHWLASPLLTQVAEPWSQSLLPSSYAWMM
jgi:hypothetical protein